jgi:oligoendopeptidase F
MNWNLNDIFNSMEEAIHLLNEAENKADWFYKKYKGKLKDLNVYEFLEALNSFIDINENISRVMTYIYLQFATDTSKGNLLSKYEEKATKIEEKILFFELEFTHLSDEKQFHFIENSGVNQFYLENLRKEAKYKLSENEEKILMKKDLTSSSAFSRLFDETISNTKFFWDGKYITEEEILSKLYSSNRNIRKRAAIALTNGLKDKQKLFTFIYNNIKKDWKITYCELRGYKTPEEPRHISNKASQKSVDALVNTTNANFDIVSEYYDIKRELLGYEKLYDYDRYAPLQSITKDIPFEKAKKIVLDSFKSFSNKFYSIALKAFKENWIDVYPKEGKRGGAFSHGATPKVHPYVMLNYTNQIRDVFTLAHELGHAIHQYLARDVGYLNQHTPLTTAETASIFAEMLVFENIKKDLNKKELLSLYSSKLEDIFATLFRQIVFTNFERRVHNSDELSEDEINTIWQEENQKMFNDSVILTSNYKIWWSYIPHFIHSPFYCYSYAYAQLLVISLFNLYKNGHKDFEEKYIEFLRSGGSIHPKEQIEIFGKNIDDEKFWQEGIDSIRNMLKEFKELKNEVTL